MQGIIKLNQIPETCKDCPFHSYASGCMLKRKAMKNRRRRVREIVALDHKIQKEEL